MFDRVRNPCHECQRRSVTCHGSCEDYALYANYREQIREARQQDQVARYAKINSVIDWETRQFRSRRK